MGLMDKHQRPLHDLRISITDRCNFRCTYCMPRDHFGPEHAFLDRGHLLSYEEIVLIVESLMTTGLRKVRITGGEPLLRKDVTKLIRMIRSVGPNLDLAMTTNGVLLSRHAPELIAAGLNRVTVSLDAVDEDVFQAMADTVNHTPAEILDGIDAALSHGLGVKVNAVIRKSVNVGQVLKLAQACTQRDVPLRFIEYMDVGNTNGWNLDEVVSGAELRSIVETMHGPLQPEKPSGPGEVARRFVSQSGHRFGFIESVSNPFCGGCSRARLSANGSLYTCLFSSNGHDLKGLLRMHASKEDVSQAVRSIWEQRNDRYSLERSTLQKPRTKVEMSFIGG